ncbi:riboflavin synthase [Blastopirellula marina]|uniref:Riboflavin synthase n=1 Tax=Blastopirellula marina TaxID=124 RepID=A0A2S8F1S5_9BACT|nr:MULTISPECIES: riboflavin synthase [Pirellulaceae]PQO26090.1 riboflavin synthase [Blastopirellula marina]RCS44448.1 riboflavin synthase [Bremerella cremea]
MFTGLVETQGKVVALKPEGPGVRLSLESPLIAGSAEIGDSIAVNGCCLTVVSIAENVVDFEAGEETLKRTNLGQLENGSVVNLERSLQLGARLGGHLVTGHIDTTATLVERNDDGEWCTMWFEVPKEYARQMASKGSVAIDGISLTLVDVTDTRFSVALIPHTLDATTLGGRKQGDTVNIETDLLAKYVQRQLETT